MKILNKKQGPEGAEYAHVYGIQFKNFSIRLHHWWGSDDNRAFHNHPYWFWTFVLKGGYRDVSHNPNNVGSKHDILSIGSLRFREADHWHTVQDVKKNTWTFLITGKPFQRWGFKKVGDNKVYKRDKYFAEFGHHAFNNKGKPIRVRPDGSRIEGD